MNIYATLLYFMISVRYIFIHFKQISFNCEISVRAQKFLHSMKSSCKTNESSGRSKIHDKRIRCFTLIRIKLFIIHSLIFEGKTCLSVNDLLSQSEMSKSSEVCYKSLQLTVFAVILRHIMIWTL